MPLTIKDGGGSGREAYVQELNRLQTTAVVSIEPNFLTNFEDGYAFSTGTTTPLVNLADDAEHAILHIQNNSLEDVDIVISEIRFFAGSAEDVLAGLLTGATVFRAYRNPTGGTITTAGVDMNVANRDFGSANDPFLFADFFTATASGLTTTGGTLAGISVAAPNQSTQVFNGGEIVLRPTNSIAITAEAPTTNFAQEVSTSGNFFLRRSVL